MIYLFRRGGMLQTRSAFRTVPYKLDGARSTMYHRTRHTAEHQSLQRCAAMPAKHDQVGVPFLRYAYNRFDNYVFQNRGPHFKAGSSESLPRQI